MAYGNHAAAVVGSADRCSWQAVGGDLLIMLTIMIIICVVLILIGMLGTASVAADVAEVQADLRKLEIRINTLRLQVDAQQTILAEEMAKNEDLKYKLISIQNTYIRIKRDNENLAHKLMRGEANESSD